MKFAPNRYLLYFLLLANGLLYAQGPPPPPPPPPPTPIDGYLIVLFGVAILFAFYKLKLIKNKLSDSDL